MASATAQLTVDGIPVTMTQTSDYPWSGSVRLEVSPQTETAFTLLVRIPGWVEQPFPSDLYRYADSAPVTVSLKVNGKPIPARATAGYVPVARRWKKGDLVELELPMPVRRVVANEKVESCRAKVVLMRGPIVYCAEGPDNGAKVHSLVVPADARFAYETRRGLLSVLKGMVKTIAWQPDGTTTVSDHELTAIPYYAWAHRGAAPMRVWLARDAKAA